MQIILSNNFNLSLNIILLNYLFYKINDIIRYNIGTNIDITKDTIKFLVDIIIGINNITENIIFIRVINKDINIYFLFIYKVIPKNIISNNF